MPFLIWPTKFLNFHRDNEGKFFFVIIIILLFLLIFSFVGVHFFFIAIFYKSDEDIKDIIELIEYKSFRDVLTNNIFNFIYVIDIDLVVFMVNWGFFILYSHGSKTADIYDFFNNNFWSFFIKCYFSFIIISTPIILCSFYSIETIIKLKFTNILLFSCIYLVLIFIFVVVFYSLYEMPLKKLLKFILIKGKISEKNEIEEDDCYEMDEKNERR